MAMILRHGMLAIFEKKKSTGTKKTNLPGPGCPHLSNIN